MRQHRAVAKLVVLLTAGVALGLTLLDQSGQSVWVSVGAATILVLLAASAYELGVALLTWVLTRTLPAANTGDPIDGNPAPAQPRARWRQLRAPQALVLVGAYLIAQLVTWTILVIVALLRTGTDVSSPLVQQEILRLAPAGLIAAMLSGAGAVILVYRAKVGTDAVAVARDDLGWGGVTPGHMALGLLVGLTIAMAYLFGAPLLAKAPRLSDLGLGSHLAATGGVARAAWAVAGVALAPVIEESLFRGALFTGLERSWGQTQAVILTTLVFGVLHLPEVGVFWPAAAVIMLLGLATALLRARTGRIAPCIAAHCAFNLVMVLTVYGMGVPSPSP